MLFTYDKINILAMKTTYQRSLHDLKEMRIINKGLYARSTNSVYFVIQMKFDEKDIICPIEMKNRADIKLRVFYKI